MTEKSTTAERQHERVALVRDLILEIFGTSGILIETGNRLVRPLGITTALWQVLAAMGFADEPQSVPMIARRMGLTRQSVQRNIDLLVERGLVAFEANPRHRRSAIATLTEAGRAALETADARHHPLSTRIADHIGDGRIADALRVLRELNAVLETDTSDADDQGVIT